MNRTFYKCPNNRCTNTTNGEKVFRCLNCHENYNQTFYCELCLPTICAVCNKKIIKAFSRDKKEVIGSILNNHNMNHNRNNNNNFRKRY